MDKRKRVELESAFLAFCNVASDMGFDIAKIGAMPSYNKINVVNNNINLDPREFIPTDTTEIHELN